jgi:hypothetical protein
MKLNARLEKLEAAYLPLVPELDGVPPDLIDREANRWESILIPSLEALGDEEAADLAWQFAASEFAGLVSLFEPHSWDKPEYHRWAVRRWFEPLRRTPRALATFLDRLPARMRCPVLRAGLTEPDDVHTGRTWLDCWLRDVCALDSRIPPDIDPEAFSRVLDVFLARRQEVASFFGLCPATGLRLPRVKSPATGPVWMVLPGKTPLVGPPPWYDVPEFFVSCPGCGAEKYGILRCQLASETERQQNWRALAERELAP